MFLFYAQEICHIISNNTGVASESLADMGYPKFAKFNFSFSLLFLQDRKLPQLTVATMIMTTTIYLLKFFTPANITLLSSKRCDMVK